MIIVYDFVQNQRFYLKKDTTNLCKFCGNKISSGQPIQPKESKMCLYSSKSTLFDPLLEDYNEVFSNIFINFATKIRHRPDDNRKKTRTKGIVGDSKLRIF